MGNMQMKFFTIDGSTSSGDNGNFLTEYPGMFLRKHPYRTNGVNCSLNRGQNPQNCTTLQYRSLSGILRHMTPGTNNLKCGCLNHTTCSAHDNRTCTTYPTDSKNPFLVDEAKTKHDHNRRCLSADTPSPNQSPELPNADKIPDLRNPANLSNNTENPQIIIERAAAPNNNEISVPQTPATNAHDKPSPRKPPNDLIGTGGQPASQKPGIAKKPEFFQESIDSSNIDESRASQVSPELAENGVTKPSADIPNVERIHSPQIPIRLSKEPQKSKKASSQVPKNKSSEGFKDLPESNKTESKPIPKKSKKTNAAPISKKESSFIESAVTNSSADVSNAEITHSPQAPKITNVDKIQSNRKPPADLSSKDGQPVSQKPAELKSISTTAAKKPEYVQGSNDSSNIDELRTSKASTPVQLGENAITKPSAYIPKILLSSTDEPQTFKDLPGSNITGSIPKPKKSKKTISKKVSSLIESAVTNDSADSPEIEKAHPSQTSVIVDEKPFRNPPIKLSSTGRPLSSQKPVGVKSIATAATEKPEFFSESIDSSNINEPLASKSSPTLLKNAVTKLSPEIPDVEKIYSPQTSEIIKVDNIPSPREPLIKLSSTGTGGSPVSQESAELKSIATATEMKPEFMIEPIDSSNIAEPGTSKAPPPPKLVENAVTKPSIDIPNVEKIPFPQTLENLDEIPSPRKQPTKFSSTGTSVSPVSSAELKNIATTTEMKPDFVQESTDSSNINMPRAPQEPPTFVENAVTNPSADIPNFEKTYSPQTPEIINVDEIRTLRNPPIKSSSTRTSWSPPVALKPAELKSTATTTEMKPEFVVQESVDSSSIDEQRASNVPLPHNMDENAVTERSADIPNVEKIHSPQTSEIVDENPTPRNPPINLSSTGTGGSPPVSQKPSELKNIATTTEMKPDFFQESIDSSNIDAHRASKAPPPKLDENVVTSRSTDIPNVEKIHSAQPFEIVDEKSSPRKPPTDLSSTSTSGSSVSQKPAELKSTETETAKKPDFVQQSIDSSNINEPRASQAPSKFFEHAGTNAFADTNDVEGIHSPQTHEITDVNEIPSFRKPPTELSSKGTSVSPVSQTPAALNSTEAVKKPGFFHESTDSSKIDEPLDAETSPLMIELAVTKSSPHINNVGKMPSPQTPIRLSSTDKPRPTKETSSQVQKSESYEYDEYDEVQPSEKPSVLRNVSTQVELDDLPNLTEITDAPKSSDILTALKSPSTIVPKTKSSVSFSEDLPKSRKTGSKPKPKKSTTASATPISKKVSLLKTKTTPVSKKASAPSNTSAQKKPTSKDKTKQNPSKSRSQRSVSTSQLRASPAPPTKSKPLKSASVKNLMPSTSPSRGVQYPSKLNRPQPIKATKSSTEKTVNGSPQKSNGAHFIADTLPRSDLKKPKSFYQKPTEKKRRVTMFRFSYNNQAGLTPHFHRIIRSTKPRPAGYIPLKSRSKPAPAKPLVDNATPVSSGPGNTPKKLSLDHTSKPTSITPKKVSLDHTSKPTSITPKKVSLDHTSKPTSTTPKMVSLDHTSKPITASPTNKATGNRAPSPKANKLIERPRKLSIAKPVSTDKPETETPTLVKKSKTTVSDENLPPPPPFPYSEIPYHRVKLVHSYYEPPPFILKKRPSRRTTTSGNNLNNNNVVVSNNVRTPTQKQRPTPVISKNSIPTTPVASRNPQEGAMELSRIAPEGSEVEYNSSESVVFFYPPEKPETKPARVATNETYKKPTSPKPQAPGLKRSSTNNYKVPSAANVRRNSKPAAVHRDKKLMNNLRTEYEMYIENYDQRMKAKRNAKLTSSQSPSEDNPRDSDGNNTNANPCLLETDNLSSCNESSSQASSQQSCPSINRCSEATDSSEIANRVISDCSSTVECERRQRSTSHQEPRIECERRHRITSDCEPTISCEEQLRSACYFYVCNLELENVSLHQIPSNQDDILGKKSKDHTKDGMKNKTDYNNNTDSETEIPQPLINPTYVDTDLDDEIQFSELGTSMEDFCPRPIPPLPNLEIELDLTPCTSIADIVLPEIPEDKIVIAADQDEQVKYDQGEDDDLGMGPYLTRVMNRTKTLLSGSTSIVSETEEDSESILSSYESSNSIHSNEAVCQFSDVSFSENEQTGRVLIRESDYDADIEVDEVNYRFRARSDTSDSETQVGRNQIKRNPAQLRIRGSLEASESEDDSAEYRQLISRYNPETVAKLKKEYLGQLDDSVEDMESHEYDTEDCSSTVPNSKQSDDEDGIHIDSGPLSSNDSLVTLSLEFHSSDSILPGRPRVSGSSSSPATARRYDYLIPPTPENVNIMMDDLEPRVSEWPSAFSSDHGNLSPRPGTLISVLKKPPGSSAKVPGENKYILERMKTSRSVHFDIPPTP